MRAKSVIVVLCLSCLGVQAPGQGFRELAEGVAKGWFARYVPGDATLGECVAFLNRHGICFSLFDLMDPKRQVTREDVARVVGQATLLFEGRAELENGCIKKPKEVQTWVDYCTLNDIEYLSLWNDFVKVCSRNPD